MTRKCNSRYLARFAEKDADADVQVAKALCHRCFRGGGMEVDPFDVMYRHVLIEDRISGEVVRCFRLLIFRDGSQINASCAALRTVRTEIL